VVFSALSTPIWRGFDHSASQQGMHIKRASGHDESRGLSFGSEPQAM
jgi:hypothetical protein